MSGKYMEPMSGKPKVLMIVCSLLAIICLLLYLAGTVLLKMQPEELRLPGGNLTSDVFERQNMKYEAVQGMDRSYYFRNMPYSVNVPRGETVKINEADILYCEPYYFYYNVVLAGEDFLNDFAKQMAAVLAPDSEASETVVEVVQKEGGNINGCYGEYMILSVEAPGRPLYCMMLYRIHVDETFFESEYDMLIGCMVNDITTQGLGNAQMYAQKTIGTLRFDTERANLIAE